MSKSEIKPGLSINITGLDGFFIVSEIKGDHAVLYSIVNGDYIERPVEDIEYALNSGAHSMNRIPLDTIEQNVDDVLQKENEEIAAVDEAQRKRREKVATLELLKRYAQAYKS